MARQAPADYREFIRLAVDLPANPKLAMIDDPAAGWAYVVSLCYCGQHLTDGSFPKGPLLRIAGVKPGVAKALIGADLWHETGHGCERCPQPIPGMVVVHDYLKHQRSAGEAKALRDARTEAGRKGAASRWAGNADSKSHSNGHSKSHANGQATGMASTSQTDARAMPELEVEEEQEIPSRPPRDEEPPGFAEFYAEYPRKRERKKAVIAYRSALRAGASPERLIQAAKSYALANRGKKMDYVKYPASWLNAGAYDDEPDQVGLALVVGGGSHVADPANGVFWEQ